MNLILILIFIAIVVMIIFWTGFRTWISRQLNALWTLVTIYVPVVATWIGGVFRFIIRALGVYSLTVLILSAIALALIFISLLIGSPAFTAFAFVFGLGLILLAWLPAGVILRAFKVTNNIVPQVIRTFVAWVAFVGFLALVFPDIASFKTMMGAALIALITLGLTARFNALDKVIFPLVALMVLTITWKHFFPENFRSTVRYTQSWDKRINTAKDRGSIGNETEAATTYAVILKDVKSLYSKPGEDMDEIVKSLDEGTLVRIVNHKQEVLVYDGQGFVEIQIAKDNGSFVNGRKYWIEAEFVRVVSPGEIMAKEKKEENSSNNSPTPQPITEVRDSIFYPGTYYIDVNGVTPFNIVPVSNRGCVNINLSSDRLAYFIMFSDGEVIKASQSSNKYRENLVFRLKAQNERIRLVVS